jgi:hypothetical protein
MILGLPESTFLAIHVGLSLIGIASGVIVLLAMAGGRKRRRLTFVFLFTTILTSAGGFLLPGPGFDPPRVVGLISLAALAIAVLALYSFRLKGIWRAGYVITAAFALYLNAFVGVIQAFQKIPALQAMAPTQTERPFLIAQGTVAVLFVVLTLMSLGRFYPR